MSNDPPRLNLITKPRYTVPLSGTVGAGPNVGLTVVAGPISFRYRVTGVEVVFRDDTQNLLNVYLLVARDNTTSTGLPPVDSNLLTPFTAISYLVGEAVIKRVNMDYTPDEDQKYLKAHAINGCTYPQTINVTITIEEA